jgi:hypothetical protein
MAKPRSSARILQALAQIPAGPLTALFDSPLPEAVHPDPLRNTEPSTSNLEQPGEATPKPYQSHPKAC